MRIIDIVAYYINNATLISSPPNSNAFHQYNHSFKVITSFNYSTTTLYVPQMTKPSQHRHVSITTQQIEIEQVSQKSYGFLDYKCQQPTDPPLGHQWRSR